MKKQYFILLVLATFFFSCHKNDDKPSSDQHDNDKSGSYQHGEVIPYQVTREEKPVTLVFIGDGFTSKDMQEGGFYEQSLNKAIEAFFSVEPYFTYKSYFNVYKIAAISEEQGADDFATGKQVNTFFDVGYTTVWPYDMQCNTDLAYSFVSTYCPDIQKGLTTIDRISIVLVINDTRRGGVTYVNKEGRNIGLFAMFTEDDSWAHTVIHESGGHGFGRLGDEYITYEENYPDDKIEQYHNYDIPYALNLTTDKNNIPWSHFLAPNIAVDYPEVGIFEGGGFYRYGIWRSSETSLMSKSALDYFNAPSRELIVKRIMQLAGETYSFEGFRAKDRIYPSTYTKSSISRSSILEQEHLMAPPVIIE